MKKRIVIKNWSKDLVKDLPKEYATKSINFNTSPIKNLADGTIFDAKLVYKSRGMACIYFLMESFQKFVQQFLLTS